MALRLITDTHIAKQIAIQLRDKGIDVIRLEELEDLPNDALDSEILEWATNNNRAVLSLDEDFHILHYQWVAEDKVHNGIFLGTRHMQGIKGIGIIVNFISAYAEDVLDMVLVEGELIGIKVEGNMENIQLRGDNLLRAVVQGTEANAHLVATNALAWGVDHASEQYNLSTEKVLAAIRFYLNNQAEIDRLSDATFENMPTQEEQLARIRQKKEAYLERMKKSS